MAVRGMAEGERRDCFRTQQPEISMCVCTRVHTCVCVSGERGPQYPRAAFG